MEQTSPPIQIRKRRSFWFRKWHPLDVPRLTVIIILHLMCLLAPSHFTWPALWVSLLLIVITGMLGIILSYHRHLTHKSFTLPKWLEYTFAYCGVQALEGDPIFWVSIHRYHHQFTDTSRDPHSPNEGFWFGHINWIFDEHYRNEKYGKTSNVNDLGKQPFYRFLKKTYILHPLALGYLLHFTGGMPFLIWGMGVRTVVNLHGAFLVNSVGHLWGKQAWNTGDNSKNNWWVAMLTFGEGWHNNHHAFQNSARAGLEWWQIDMTWGVIKLLEMVGLATDVTTRKMLIINGRFRCFYTFSVRNVIKIDGIFRWKVVDYKAVDFIKSVDVNIIYNGYFR